MPRVSAAIPAFLLLIAVCAEEVSAQDRYLAVFADGSRASSTSARYVDLPSTGIRFDGRPLFDGDNPARLLRDLQRLPELRPPYVELANGDVLPGRVVAYETVTSDPPGPSMPARMLVSLRFPLFREESTPLPVRADRVSRIVGSRPVAQPVPPGHLRLADGTTHRYRSLRWSEDGVRALTDAELLSIPFDQLAEIQITDLDIIDAVMADSLAIAGTDDATLERVASEDGSILTFSRMHSRVGQERPTRRGGRSAEEISVRIIQPEWAPGSLRVPIDTIIERGYRRPSEIPLSLLPAQTLTQKSLVAGNSPWRRNQSVHGSRLMTGRLDADVGIGMHAYCEAAFQLPPQAQSFSCWVGLNYFVGQGGCVRCRIFADKPEGEPLWQSDYLRGGEDPRRVGPLDVKGAARLILVADYAHPERPTGADPLDIRDDVDWLFPLVQVELPGQAKGNAQIELPTSTATETIGGE